VAKAKSQLVPLMGLRKDDGYSPDEVSPKTKDLFWLKRLTKSILTDGLNPGWD